MRDSLCNTFERRDTNLPTALPMALTEEFSKDLRKVIQWKAFLRKSKLADPTKFSLEYVVETIAKLIVPVLLDKDNNQEDRTWHPERLKWGED